MNYITFLIGNGFDINLGLKTKYTDFYDEYIKSNENVDKDSSIGKFCDMIRSDYKTWSDFEGAFAQNIWGTKDVVSDISYDFSTKFSEYLRKQVELCDYSNEKIPDKIRTFLTNGYDTLEPLDKEIIKNQNNQLQSEDITVDFINFNYTNTLAKLLDLFISNNKGSKTLYSYRASRAVGSVACSSTIGQILYIHGKLGENVIIGANSLQQLANEDLRNDEKIAKYCVKSEMNKDYGNVDKENKFAKMIRRSSIIYAYGLSFGESDRSRWDLILKWFKADNGHKLIIFKFNTGFEKYNKAYPRKLLDAIDLVKDEYLGLLGIAEEEYEKYYNQIFIVDSSAVLNFKLIDENIENGEDTDESKEPVTV